MAKKSLEERVSAIEVQLGDKTLQEHFREQAELIDGLFAYHLVEIDKRFGQVDKRFDEMNRDWDARLDAKFESNLAPIRSDLGAVKDALRIILGRLN